MGEKFRFDEKKDEKEIVLRFSSNQIFLGLIVIVVLAFLGIAFLFLGPNSTGLNVLQPAENQQQEQAQVAAGEQAEVAAIVNGKKIFVSEIEKSFERLPEQFEGQVTKGSILENLIDITLVLQEAEKEGITVEQSEVNELYAQQEDYIKSMMGQTGITKEEILKSIEESLIFEKFFQESVFAKIEVTEQEIADFFEENKEDLKQVNASHILVEEKEKAEELLTQLNEGADFAELAKENSTDTVSGEDGGELGFFSKGDVVQEFGDAAFALEPGELSEVVETQFGFHIILVSEVRDDLQSFADQIQAFLLQNKQDQAYTDMLTRLKDNAQIEVFFEEN